jgi:hypothetical protein
VRYGACAPRVSLIRPDGHLAHSGAPQDLDGLRAYLDRIHVRQRLRPVQRTADGSAADLGGRSALPLASTAHKTARRESGTVSGMCWFWPVEPRLSITTNALLLELILGCLRHPLVPSADRSSERIPREGIWQADPSSGQGSRSWDRMRYRRGWWRCVTVRNAADQRVLLVPMDTTALMIGGTDDQSHRHKV